MDAAIELRPGSLLGGFRIDSPIGRGGMGVVYRATQLSLERQVALKLISPDLAQEKRFRERFLREARLAASLDHQHLLPVHEAGEAEGTLFLAMRLVEGASLAELLRREGRLAPERAVRLLAQVAEALEAAHAVGLLHRDVKPQNVLVAGAGKREHAYLCDFGLSRRLAGGSLTREGAFVGTAAYAAPEQIRGDQLDGGCDLYSLACLLYECLTGDPPFAREDELALLWAHLHEPPPAVSGVNPALAPFDAFFSRALAKDPGERYPSASALVEAALAAPGSEAAPAEGSRRPGPTARLPRPLTPFLGRERELQELLALLLEDETRLLTLTGPGGTGKTRLALRVAEEAAEAFPDGVFWVGLASLRDFALVTETIAQMLEAKDSLPERIGERKLLLLLDNFEQVVEAAPEFSPLLASCPSLALLVTSRELLRVQGEVEYAVPPLAEPEAVSLFCARSRLAPTEEITELCARLDNLPLAVELAAARAKVLSPTQILERLSQRLDLLKGGRDADPRQQTLRAAIEWSYDLLSEAERQLFARLSVFPGTFSLEAAEEVCDADLDTLATLVDKSLLRRGHDGRFFMLATIREYALERLDTGESETVGGRHAAVVSTLAGSEGPAYLAGVWGERLARLEPEQDNIRAALSWLFDHGADGAACRLCSSVWPLWYQLGNLEEARRALTRALPVSAGASHEVRAALYAGTALLAREAGELEKARALHEQQLELAAELGDEEIRAAGLELLGITLTYLGEFNEAASVLQECVDTFRHAGDQSQLGMALNDLGLALMELGDRSGAWAVFEEGLSFERSPENSVTLSFLLHSAGSLAAREGNSEKAKALLREGLALFLELGDKQGVADSLETLGTVAAGRHLAERAAVLWGAGGHLRDELGVEMQMSEREMHDAALDTVMRALGEDEFRSATHRGASMTSDEAVAFALSVG